MFFYLCYSIMVFSVLYEKLIQHRLVFYRNLFFHRLAQQLQSQTIKARHLWMRRYAKALQQHSQALDVRYYISTRSANHFLQSLDTILTQGHVDYLCMEICYRHVCHLCTCRNNQEVCLEPHT